jgi:hypothetical protein
MSTRRRSPRACAFRTSAPTRGTRPEFQTTVRGLLGLRDRLAAHRVEQVVMEATGVYWKAPWAILEDDFESDSGRRSRARRASIRRVIGFVPQARGGVMSELLLDRAGRRRSPATMPGFHAGHAPGNKGLRYPADPPKVEEIVAVMRAAGDRAHGRRLRGLIANPVAIGSAHPGALALAESDLDHRRGSLLVRRGKGGRRREVGMDAWGWEQLGPWLELRRELPVGPLLCVIHGTTRGRHWSPAAARAAR